MTTNRFILALMILAASACDAMAQVPQLWKQKTGAPTIIVPVGATPYSVEVPSTQLRLRSSDGGAKSLTFGISEALTADRALTWNVGNAARTITLSGSPTMGDWFDQSVKSGGTPSFLGVTTGTSGVTVGGTIGAAIVLKASPGDTGQMTLATSGGTRAFDLAGNFSVQGGFQTTLVNTAATSVILPTTGTLSTLAGSEALTNKTINGNTITTGTGTLTLAASSSLITAGAFSSTLTGTATSDNTLPSGTNTLYSTKSGSITSAELASSLTDETGTGTFVRNTSPVFATGISMSSDSGINVQATRASTDTGGSVWFARKARGTIAAPTAVAVGDALGTFLFQGYNDAYRSSAAIAAIADTGYGATGADAPGALIFYTTPDGSATQIENARLTSSGTFGVGSSTPLGKFETRSTTSPQFVSSNTASQYVSLSTTSAGITTIAAAGTTPTIDLSATSGVSINAGTPVKRMLTATATLDFPSMAALTESDLTITVTGAAVGDSIAIGPPSTLEANLVVSYYAVTGTNTVTVRVRNANTISAMDPASKTWRATVIGF